MLGKDRRRQERMAGMQQHMIEMLHSMTLYVATMTLLSNGNHQLGVEHWGGYSERTC